MSCLKTKRAREDSNRFHFLKPSKFNSLGEPLFQKTRLRHDLVYIKFCLDLFVQTLGSVFLCHLETLRKKGNYVNFKE